jgi:hypothetical protein
VCHHDRGGLPHQFFRVPKKLQNCCVGMRSYIAVAILTQNMINVGFAPASLHHSVFGATRLI